MEPDQDKSQKNNTEESGDDFSDNTVSTSYHTEDVLYEASILRHDLLGNITDFECAFNFFKYDFTTMVFFSAFIAAFFDLGAFLTGCFLYGMEHFKHQVGKKE